MGKFTTVVLCSKLLTCLIVKRSFRNMEKELWYIQDTIPNKILEKHSCTNDIRMPFYKT